MREENKRMKKWLADKGIDARVKLIRKGSLSGCWRLYNPKITWSTGLADELNSLGFYDFDGSPLDKYSCSAGLFSIFARIKKEDIYR